MNTVIIIPQAEVNEKDSVRGYLELCKQQYQSWVCFGVPLRFFLERRKISVKRAPVYPQCSSESCAHESDCIMDACEPGCLYQISCEWKWCSSLNVCPRPATFRPPGSALLAVSTNGSLGGLCGVNKVDQHSLLWQCIRKHLPLSYSLNSHYFNLARPQEAWKILKWQKDPKTYIQMKSCIASSKEKLIPTMVQAALASLTWLWKLLSQSIKALWHVYPWSTECFLGYIRCVLKVACAILQRKQYLLSHPSTAKWACFWMHFCSCISVNIIFRSTGDIRCCRVVPSPTQTYSIFNHSSVQGLTALWQKVGLACMRSRTQFSEPKESNKKVGTIDPKEKCFCQNLGLFLTSNAWLSRKLLWQSTTLVPKDHV